MKPMADGTWKEAGAHLEVYSLDHSCGAKALVDTETATAFSWKDASGKEYITSPAVVHMFPSTSTPIKGHFVPEERAKKVSFDRMIFKIEEVPGMDQIEYRSDVTMREDCLEYDVTIINRSDRAQDVTMGLKFNLSGGMKVVAMKGYTQKTDDSVSTGKVTKMIN